MEQVAFEFGYYIGIGIGLAIIVFVIVSILIFIKQFYQDAITTLKDNNPIRVLFLVIGIIFAAFIVCSLVILSNLGFL